MSNQAPQAKFSVAIVGGGIAGLCLALGLLEHPEIDFQVYESAHEFREVGLGVNIAPNAQRALHMISPSTAKAFESLETPNAWNSHAHSFTTCYVGMKGPQEDKLITTQLNQTGMRSVFRAKFLDQLVNGIPKERTHFNKRVIGIDEKDTTSKLTLHFQDGSTGKADCVVGADGIHSRTRHVMLGDKHYAAEPKFTGTACYRSICPTDVAIEKVGKEYAENCHMLCGPGAAIFSYPVEHGALFNIIMMHFDHPVWEHEKWIVPSSRDELASILKGWGKTAEDFVDIMSTHDPTAWKMHDNPSAPNYNKGRICIMGDAAHATTPFQGQGAGQAIEDALVMKTLLASVKDVRQLRFAFQAFDLSRRARSESVVTTSRHSGLVYGMMAENIGSDVDKMKEELDMSFRWMWNRDLEDQNREAIRLFQETIAEPQ